MPLSWAEVTFKGGLASAGHSWFRLTYSFSPHLVAYLLDVLQARHASNGTTGQAHDPGAGQSSVRRPWVLDPFLGGGTTAIECKRRGINVVGVDVNPLFVKVGRVCTNWSLDPMRLSQQVAQIVEAARRLTDDAAECTVGEFCQRSGLSIPPIRDPQRWWRPDVLKALLILKHSVRAVAESSRSREFFEAALAAILLEVANIHRGHPTLTFCDRGDEKIDVFEHFVTRTSRMIEELANLSGCDQMGACTIVEGDSTRLRSTLAQHIETAGRQFDLVITSPPYPNRISYVWETRPHLYFLDLFHLPGEAGALDLRTIGGTWGVATSTISVGTIEPADVAVQRALGGIDRSIRERSNLMANYVVKYFNMMYEHLRELRLVLAPGARCAYVVGNSRIKDVEVFTDVILAELFASAGFHVEEILVIRQRGGRKRLYEAVVFASC